MKTQTRLAISLSNDPMDTEYVTLKETQKIQDLLDYTRKIASVQDKDLESLKVKVEVANKILAELDVSNFATGETRKDGTEYHNFNIDQWYARLKASLSQEEKTEIEQ